VGKSGFSYRDFISLGVRSGDSDDIRTAKIIWWVCMCFAIPSCWIMMALSLMLHWGNYSQFWLAMSVYFTVLFVLFAVVRRGIEWIGLASQAFLIVASLTFAAREGGLLRSGGLVFMGLIGPLYALAFPKIKRAAYLMLLYLAGVGTIAAFQSKLEGLANLPASANLWHFVASFSAMGIFTFIALLYFVTQRTSALQRLAEEQERSEKLLLNILPKEIAVVLMRENRIIANQYVGASVLFADIVDFTPMSARMTAVEIVELLNEVFSYFDSLVDRFGLEKIKTIGDCYMVASGIPKPRPDHAQALTDMALEIQALVRNRAFGRGLNLEFRIGIHSGPLVAGVIGHKKFSYDLWGDAVNTASRMESQGVAGTIQITRNTYDLIKNEFSCLAMPPVLVKGKGEMDVWHVQGRLT
jgi:adenylate cyclase